ncbi:MAG: DUF4132 domain-containing protein, partial [Myxococcales bacterium]|nr:DUF4132 domain-containing protein [Myxococcales bacterium]
PVTAPPGLGRLEWSPALTKLAASAPEAGSPPLEGIDDPNALYQQIGVWGRDGKAAIEHGLHYHPEQPPFVKKVTWAYFGIKPPASLDPDVEAAAFLMLTSVPGIPHRDLAWTMVRYWANKEGLPFAIDAWSRTLGPWHAVGYSWGDQPKLVLLPADAPPLRGAVSGAPRPAERITSHAVLDLLRQLVAAADDAATLRARIDELAARDAVTAIAMAALIQDQEALAKLVAARDGDGREMFVLGWDALALLPPSGVAELLTEAGRDTCIHLGSVPDRYRRRIELSQFARYLERHREAALPVAFAWTRRCTDFLLEEDSHYGDYEARQLLRALLEVLGQVRDSAALAEVLADLCTRLAKLNFTKDEDPRPIALQMLSAMPERALPALRAHRQHAWAKRLLPQLERATGEVELVAEASASAVPPELSGKTFDNPPPFFDPKLLPQILLHNGSALPPSAVEAVGLALAKDDQQVIDVVKSTCSPRSLARFAWELFVSWEGKGAPSKHKWGMMALGHFGDDEVAQSLTPMIRRWPGEAQHRRAVNGLEVLAGIGSDVALMCLNGIAQKVKFKGLQRNAREKMDEIAKRRGFSTEELEDRLVPDLELEDDGSMELDFGPRSFRVGFDEALKPFVIDAKGKQRASLPKPSAKDDAALANEAVERFKTMKASVRALASIQVARLEQAMGRRRWPAADFEAFLVHHPLMFHLVRRLVWGVADDAGAPQACFRVAEDRSYADAEDEPFELADDATVVLVHRLHLNDAERAKWRTVFADYELRPPFDQLDREIFRLEPSDLSDDGIIRYVNREVATSKLRGLVSRGWRHGTPQDAGFYHCFGKPIQGDMSAWLPIENGISVSGGGYDDDTQKLGVITFGSDEPWYH